MEVSPLAGKPADPSILIDVPGLVTAYYTEQPDPSVPAQRVAFGTSGHRGCSLDNSFNEAHILAITQAICLYRKQQSIDGPLYIGIDTHALSEPAFRQCIGSAGGQRRRRDGRCGQWLHADAGDLACDSQLQPGPQARPCRRYRHHAIAQSAAIRRLQIQSSTRRTGGHSRNRNGSRSGPTPSSRTVCAEW